MLPYFNEQRKKLQLTYFIRIKQSEANMMVLDLSLQTKVKSFVVKVVAEVH